MTKIAALGDLLEPAAISLDLRARTKPEVLRELVSLAASAGLVPDPAAALQAVETRESQGSTGVGSGVAVPHARVSGLSGTVVAVGLSKEGVDFGGPDRVPVRIFFLLLGPQNAPEIYLKTLSQVARLIKDAEPTAAIDLIRSQAA